MHKPKFDIHVEKSASDLMTSMSRYNVNPMFWESPMQLSSQSYFACKTRSKTSKTILFPSATWEQAGAKTNLNSELENMRCKTLLTGFWEKNAVEIIVSGNTLNWPNSFYRQAENFWQKALKSKTNLFNGRLSSLVSAKTPNGKLILTLGEICYRDQMFSNNMMQVWAPEKKRKYAAHGLGISAIVETVDGHVLMILRSENVSDHENLLDVLGGHVHPQKHALNGSTPEVFYAIEDEIHCELGVEFRDITKTVCIGLVENVEWLKPELVFVSNLKLAANEVLDCAKHAEEGFEYTEIESFPATASGVSGFLAAHGHRCTPSAEGCLHLYKMFLNG